MNNRSRASAGSEQVRLFRSGSPRGGITKGPATPPRGAAVRSSSRAARCRRDSKCPNVSPGQDICGNTATRMEQLDGEKLSGLELSAHEQGDACGRQVPDRRRPGTAGARVEDLTTASGVADEPARQPALQIIAAPEERHTRRVNFRPRPIIIHRRGWIVHHQLAHSVGTGFRTGRRGSRGVIGWCIQVYHRSKPRPARPHSRQSR